MKYDHRPFTRMAEDSTNRETTGASEPGFNEEARASLQQVRAEAKAQLEQARAECQRSIDEIRRRAEEQLARAAVKAESLALAVRRAERHAEAAEATAFVTAARAAQMESSTVW